MNYRRISPIGIIPNDWQLKSLYNIASVEYGISDPLNKTLEQGVRIIGLQNVSQFGTYSDEPQLFVKQEQLGEDSLLQKEDILFCWRSGSKEHIGKTYFYDLDGIYTHVGFLLRIRCNKQAVDPAYLHTYIKHIKERGYFLDSKIQVNSTFNKGELLDLPIVLPPLGEQRKIAEILSTWDEAIALTNRLIATLKRRKQALMQLLLTGKVRFPEFEGEEWEEGGFATFAVRSNKQIDPSQLNEDLPCIELEHIEQSSGQILGYISAKGQRSIKNFFSSGQILFGKLRPYLRKYAQPNFYGAASSEIWILSGREGICTNDYLFYLIQSDTFINIANATSGTKMPRADWGLVSESIFALPSIQEQEKISKLLKEMDHEINILSEIISLAEIQKRGLMQQLLTGAVRV